MLVYSLANLLLVSRLLIFTGNIYISSMFSLFLDILIDVNHLLHSETEHKTATILGT